MFIPFVFSLTASLVIGMLFTSLDFSQLTLPFKTVSVQNIKSASFLHLLFVLGFSLPGSEVDMGSHFAIDIERHALPQESDVDGVSFRRKFVGVHLTKMFEETFEVRADAAVAGQHFIEIRPGIVGFKKSVGGLWAGGSRRRGGGDHGHIKEAVV